MLSSGGKARVLVIVMLLNALTQAVAERFVTTQMLDVVLGDRLEIEREQGRVWKLGQVEQLLINTGEHRYAPCELMFGRD